MTSRTERLQEAADRAEADRGPDIQVTESDGEPIDVEGWAARYVRMVLELEGVQRVATPPSAAVG